MDRETTDVAIADALLGAAGLGDLGEHFPAEAVAEGASSLQILARTAVLLADAGFSIVNIDTIVVIQRVRVAPHRRQMVERIAEALSVDPSRISVKATTSSVIRWLPTIWCHRRGPIVFDTVRPKGRWRAFSSRPANTAASGFAAIAPFALYHFHRMTHYGLVANLIAAPLVSVLIMPMAVLSLAGIHSIWAIVLPQYLFAIGHGVHQPCGQAGAVGPFPEKAGTAASLSVFRLKL